MDKLEPDVDFFRYQNMVNRDVDNVASHSVIARHIAQHGQDYRFELAPNPIEALRNRKCDNVDVGRTKMREMAGVR